MYITFDEYSELYDTIDEKLFNRLAFDASRMMDFQTTGIDGVRKLREAFPQNEDDVRAVKHCAAKVVNLLHQIHEAEVSSTAARGYEATEQGVRGKIITSVSAGNESISYSAKSSAETVVDKAVSDIAFRDSLVAGLIWKGLSGVSDANGVGLLYMGKYPGRCRC
ncbi:MAG: hypothetical protein J6V25_04215 [Oscillospiraceae bacterium]|nr:hypothetical protein [Oscillospiraceae bacterium]